MGRYYNGDINGKFGFGFVDSDAFSDMFLADVEKELYYFQAEDYLLDAEHLDLEWFEDEYDLEKEFPNSGYSDDQEYLNALRAWEKEKREIELDRIDHIVTAHSGEHYDMRGINQILEITNEKADHYIDTDYPTYLYYDANVDSFDNEIILKYLKIYYLTVKYGKSDIGAERLQRLEDFLQNTETLPLTMETVKRLIALYVGLTNADQKLVTSYEKLNELADKYKAVALVNPEDYASFGEQVAELVDYFPDIKRSDDERIEMVGDIKKYIDDNDLDFYGLTVHSSAGTFGSFHTCGEIIGKIAMATQLFIHYCRYQCAEIYAEI